MINIKRVKTLLNGAPYRNYCTDAGGDFPIHGAYWHAELKTWRQISHTIIGEYIIGRKDKFDLKVDPEMWRETLVERPGGG